MSARPNNTYFVFDFVSWASTLWKAAIAANAKSAASPSVKSNGPELGVRAVDLVVPVWSRMKGCPVEFPPVFGGDYPQLAATGCFLHER